MAKNIETMALTAMAGMYGCELLNTTDEYTAPAGLGIAFVMPRDGAVIESYSYLRRKNNEIYKRINASNSCKKA